MTHLRFFHAASTRTPMFFGAILLMGLALQVSVASKLATAGTILVSDRATNSVLKFDGNSGAFLGALIEPPTSGGLYAPTSMTIGFNGDLFVTSVNTNTGNAQILRYNPTTGAFLGVFADTGSIEAIGSVIYSPTTNTLLAGSLGSGLGTSSTIYQYNSAGAITTNITTGTISGRTGLTFGPNGHLFVSTFWDDEGGPPFAAQGGVMEFDTANNFNSLGYFIDPNTEGLPAGLYGASGSVFDSNNSLYVASLFGQSVVKFNPSGTSGSQFGDNLAYPSGLGIAQDGNLLVTSLGNDNPNDPNFPILFPGAIFKYDINTGATIGGPNTPFISNGSSFQPTSMLIFLDAAGPAPEPSSVLLLMGGVLFGARKLRRRTR